jgi:glucose-6-phosphate isomerase
LAESIGKEKNMEGRIVHEGITPTTSIGPTDLHSMAQLYLGGPNDKFFRIVTIDSPPKDLRIPPSKEIEELAPNASGKRLSQIMDAISGGLKAAYSSRSIPFVHVRMADLSERSVGALLQMEMIEVMLLAKLFGVNAFDQPAVEEYKKEAKKLLSENKTGIKE